MVGYYGQGSNCARAEIGRSLLTLRALNLNVLSRQWGGDVAGSLIKRRCVISIGDYETLSVAQQFASFQAGLQRFSQTWTVSTKISPFKTTVDGAIAVWHVETKAKNWKVNTEFRLFNWADISNTDLESWNWLKVSRVVRALYDNIATGTCWRYLKLNKRFAIFFLYPVLAVLFTALGAYFLAALLSLFGLPFTSYVSVLTAAVIILAYIKWVDPDILPRVMNMWVLIHDLVHDKRAGLAERLEVFVQDIVAILQSKEFDEIVIAGHGFGAALQVAVVDRAFWHLKEYEKSGRQICMLSTGSLLLAIALHPEGSWLIGPVSRITRDKMIYWAEYQAQEDVISFAGVNPATVLVGGHSKPSLQQVKIKNMIKIEKQFLPEAAYQYHRQLVRANSRKYFYDFFMICCGPFALPTRIEDPELMITAFYADGRLVFDE